MLEYMMKAEAAQKDKEDAEKELEGAARGWTARVRAGIWVRYFQFRSRVGGNGRGSECSKLESSDG